VSRRPCCRRGSRDGPYAKPRRHPAGTGRACGRLVGSCRDHTHGAVALNLAALAVPDKTALQRLMGESATMAGPKFTLVTRTQGNNQALKDGTVKPKTFEPEIVEVDPIIAAFRRMVRGNEFDICEMAITTYICAKAHGKPMTAVPVPLLRAFHHGAILINTK